MKYSVLTCLFGNYENLKEINEPQKDVEYICVTDNKELMSDTWTIVVVDDFILSLPFVNQWTYIRYHPFEFVNTDVCIYIDASVKVEKDFTDILMKPFIESDYEYGVMIHPWRSNIMDEVVIWARERNYSIESINKIHDWLCKNDYKIEGLIQSTILLQKNTRNTNIINNRTWELCHQWGNNGEIDRNNQGDLTYVINTCFFDSPYIFIMSPQVIHNSYLYWHTHDGIKTKWDNSNSGIFFNKRNKGKAFLC